MTKKKESILITGVAGFIGAAVAKKFLKNNFAVIGIDNMNDYYSKKLKEDRIKNIHKNLDESSNWEFFKVSIENNDKLEEIFEVKKPNYVINLTAQAGGRYSLINPMSYVNSNLVGFANILENSKKVM